MGLMDWFKRSDPNITWGQLLNQIVYQGYAYQAWPQQSLGSSQDEISETWLGYIRDIYKSNGIVFACMETRRRLFSLPTFQFQQLRNGQPGDLFGTQELDILENPWPNGTTGDLLSKAIQDVDLEGNFYAYRDGNRLRRMRPDWVSIGVGGSNERDLEIIGYGYHPGGYNSREPVMVMHPEEVIHWAPIPDPEARFRGMSWITPILREIQADNAATEHQLGFWEHGATPNMIARLPETMTKEKFDEWVTKFREGHEGSENAYKTLFLGGGADVSVVGATLAQADFKTIQGAGETRIAAASGMPPIIVGLSEGLSYATYSNYGQARRHAADACLRPLWEGASTAFSSVINVPGGSRLWYDDRHVMFLQEDQQDAATITNTKASTISTLLAAGFEATSAIAAVNANDFSFLSHTGLFSVQLQPIATPEIYMAQVMAGVQQQESATAKTLIDAGFEPSSVMNAIDKQDLSLLTHTGMFGVQLGPIGQVGQGKGSLVQGEVVPAGVGQNSVRALLEPFLDERSE
jgi:hypothetical protein